MCEKKIVVMICDFWNQIMKGVVLPALVSQIAAAGKPTAARNKQPWGGIEDSCQEPAPGHWALEADASPVKSQMTAASSAITSWNTKPDTPEFLTDTNYEREYMLIAVLNYWILK